MLTCVVGSLRAEAASGRSARLSVVGLFVSKNPLLALVAPSCAVCVRPARGGGGSGGHWPKCFRLPLFALAAFLASIAAAAPVSIEQVQKLAGGVASSVQVSYASGAAICMAQAVPATEAKVSAVASADADDASGTAFYVIDRGSVGGFVVMSADDRLDPVIVIAPTGKFDFTPGTPLYDMLSQDIPQRLAVAEKTGAGRSRAWSALLERRPSCKGHCVRRGLVRQGHARRALVQSKWGQSDVDNKAVFNYYTPPYDAGSIDNYVCGNDITAALLLRTLGQIGVSVPADMLVTGFNDVSISRLSSSSITTVRQPTDVIGQTVLRRLFERIANPDLPIVEILVNAPLVARESTNCKPTPKRKEMKP